MNPCIQNKVRRTFPDPEGSYKGYEYTIEHMNLMLEMKEEVKKKAAMENEKQG